MFDRSLIVCCLIYIYYKISINQNSSENIFSSYEKSVIRQVLNEIAESVFDDLDNLDVESEWEDDEEIQQKDVDPEELASRMYDDVIESDLDVLREYQNQSRDDSATTQCMGY